MSIEEIDAAGEKPSEGQQAEIDNIQRNEVFLRQMELADPAKFKVRTVTVLGAGAIGTVVAIGAAKLGTELVRIIDYDRFEDHNVANQLCIEASIGEFKSTEVATLADQMSSAHTRAHSIPWKLAKSEDGQFVFQTYDGQHVDMAPRAVIEGIVVSCPDDMDARRHLWELCKFNPKTPLLIDVRVAGQYFHILTTGTMATADVKRYEVTLHSNEEATEIPCGARGIIYTSLIAGGEVVNLIKRFQMSEDLPREIRRDLQWGQYTLVLKDGKEVTNATELALAVAENP